MTVAYKELNKGAKLSHFYSSLSEADWLSRLLGLAFEHFCVCSPILIETWPPCLNISPNLHFCQSLIAVSKILWIKWSNICFTFSSCIYIHSCHLPCHRSKHKISIFIPIKVKRGFLHLIWWRPISYYFKPASFDQRVEKMVILSGDQSQTRHFQQS